MRRRRQFALLFLSFLGIAPGCGGSVEPAGKIVVSAEVTPASIRAGSMMKVAVTVSNVSDAAWNINTKCFGVFDVIDQLGVAVGPAPILCSFDLTPPDLLGPNGMLNYSASWSGESRATTDSAKVFLPVGSYLLRPRVMVGNQGFIYGPSVQVTIIP